MAKQCLKPKLAKEDVRPDAWERFERAVNAAAKSGPKHRTKTAVKRKATRKKK